MKILTVVFLLYFSQCAVAASFDCESKKISEVEKIICSDKSLSSKDDIMSELYASAREYYAVPDFSFTDTGLIRSHQLDWIKQRNKCNSSACLAELYDKQIDILRVQNERLRKHRGANYIYTLIRPFLNARTYEIDRLSIEIPFYYQPYNRDTIYVLFEATASGFFNSFKRSGTGYCGGDSDHLVGFIKYNAKEGIVQKNIYIGNACPAGSAAPIIAKDQDGYSIQLYNNQDTLPQNLTGKSIFELGSDLMIKDGELKKEDYLDYIGIVGE